MIKAIIFDFGGVILDLKNNHLLGMPKSLSILFNLPINEANDYWSKNRLNLVTGRETPLQFLERTKRVLKVDKPTDSLFQKWEKMNLKDKEHIDWDVVTYIEELKKKFKVYVLSDATDIGQDNEFMKNIEATFDGYFVSYREGFSKPRTEAFLNVINKIKLKPEECVFIDDSKKNIEVANSLKMKAFHFTGLDQLKKDLRFL